MSQVTQKNRSSMRVWEYDKVIRRALAPIVRVKRLRWSVSDLKVHFHATNWTVSYHTLDLETGRSSNSQCFLKLCTPEQVEDMLNTKKPWRDRYTPAEDLPFTLKDQPFANTRFDNARDVWACISGYLEGYKRDG